MAKYVDLDQVKELLAGVKHDAPLSPVGPYNHGAGGLFNTQGAENNFFSAMMSPALGLMSEIPVYNGGIGSNDAFGGEDVDTMSMLTGVTSGAADLFSNQPTGDCAVGPVGGLRKICEVINTYGRYRISTREVSIVRAGRREDFADPLTLRLMNNPLVPGRAFVPSTTPTVQNTFMNEIAARIWESVVSAQRMFAPRVWTGSPANNSGERRDIMGMDLHLNVGTHIDKYTMSVCSAADADLKNFNYGLVNGTAPDIVQHLEMVDDYVHFNASRQGLTPFVYDIYMRPELWRELSAVWPVRQHLSALTEISRFTNGSLNVSGGETLKERNDLRASHMLPLNGRLVRVIEDDTIPEQTPVQTGSLLPGQYASDIYGVPRYVMGSIPVTFWKYFNHNNNQSNEIAKMAGAATFTTDNGLFRWYVNTQNGCVQLTFEWSPKLFCLTPQLGWRIQNVAYRPLQHMRTYDPNANNAAYFFDGGKTNSPVEQFYAPWSPTTRVTP